jgi:hypothetical protein
MTGLRLASIFIDTMQKLGTLNSMFTITTNNDFEMVAMVGMVELTVKAHLHRDHTIHRMFCIGDVIEHAAQDILKAGIGPGLNDHAPSIQKPCEKLRKCISWIISVDENQERFESNCTHLSLPETELKLDVEMHWITTYEMLAQAMTQKNAINSTMEDGPESIRLSSDDWQSVNVALHILNMLHKSAELNCSSEYASINMATATFIALRSRLQEVVDTFGK